MSRQDLAVVVLSCDKFSSLWPLFFNRLDAHFPKNYAKIYLLSNYCEFSFNGSHLINVITVGEDISWSITVKILHKIPEKNILLLMDDAPLAATLEETDLDYYYKIFVQQKMNYFNLKGSPAPNTNLKDFFGELLPSTGYRTSVVPNLWKKDTLLKLLIADENAWQFEIFGSQRSKKYDGFFSAKKSVICCDHIVIKGKIDRSMYKKLQTNDEHHAYTFPVMTRWESLTEKIKFYISKTVKALLPENFISLVRKIKYGD